ncbi:Radical SAM domain protein [Thermogladius calderae 1633]|uniref:Radical SAM domain protein n=1 Tax=Thermogladius calderae (strain DSM 22663 / VKM B-2946 / 1633) TaxID=1184251 RepID=I3TE78_THEC1|nr:radical SAM protein [Thermogladius calderae]AFK51066.1 Radical SAM domain protein [Thermogladius calderae 1633]
MDIGKSAPYGDTRKLSVLRPFDPWKSPLCTCPLKYSLHPYTGCSHFCLYCYASSYIGRRPSTPKRGFLERLRKDLNYVNPRLVIELSSSSDPYPPLEEWLRLTRRTLQVLSERKLKVLITTKGDIVVRDIDILRETPSAVMITITTIDNSLASKLEPGAPSPSRRLRAVEKLSEAGIPVGVRIDPILPGLNDDPASIKELVDAVANAGAKHVVTSTYKLKPDSYRRIVEAFPELEKLYKRLYFEEGELIQGYRYLGKPLRARMLAPVIEFSVARGLTAAVCREGLGVGFLRAPSCDGSHLVASRVPYERG